MNRSTAPQSLTIQFRPLPSNDAIEWEEMPKLAVRRTGEEHEGGAAWKNTMPASLMDTIAPPKPFREALDGLSMREVDEPEIFQHFFGK